MVEPLKIFLAILMKFLANTRRLHLKERKFHESKREAGRERESFENIPGASI